MKKIYPLFILVFSAIVLAGCTNTGDNQQPKTTGDNPETQQTQGDKGPRQEVDLTAAAEKLGVTEEQLQAALAGDNGRPDMKAAAEKLGVTEEQLQAALGMPENMPSGQPNQQGQPEQPGGPENPDQQNSQ